MLPLSTLSMVLSALMVAGSADARILVAERDGKVVLAPRRTDQGIPAGINDYAAACRSNACASLAGGAVATLLAASPECAMQDAADNMITVAKSLTDPVEIAGLIAAAVNFRQGEKNTQPDFSTNPVTGRNSVYCTKAPVNAELNGLVQAQDPANDPNLFTDPQVKGNVQAGSQLNTFPFGSPGFLAFQAGGNGTAPAPAASSAAPAAAESSAVASSAAPVASATEAASSAPVAEATSAPVVEASSAPVAEVSSAPVAEVTTAAPPAATTTACPGRVTVTVTAGAAAATDAPPAAASTIAAAPVADTTATAPAAEATAAATGDNLQTFTGTLGAPAPEVFAAAGGKFTSTGVTFNSAQSAIDRSCSRQANLCSNAVNGGTLAGSSVADCFAQEAKCKAANV